MGGSACYLFCNFLPQSFLVLALHLESGSFPRPSALEENCAFFRTAGGDPAVSEKLIRHNLRLVAHIVKYYALPAWDDLISSAPSA